MQVSRRKYMLDIVFCAGIWKNSNYIQIKKKLFSFANNFFFSCEAEEYKVGDPPSISAASAGRNIGNVAEFSLIVFGVLLVFTWPRKRIE